MTPCEHKGNLEPMAHTVQSQGIVLFLCFLCQHAAFNSGQTTSPQLHLLTLCTDVITLGHLISYSVCRLCNFPSQIGSGVDYPKS